MESDRHEFVSSLIRATRDGDAVSLGGDGEYQEIVSGGVRYYCRWHRISGSPFGSYWSVEAEERWRSGTVVAVTLVGVACCDELADVDWLRPATPDEADGFMRLKRLDRMKFRELYTDVGGTVTHRLMAVLDSAPLDVQAKAREYARVKDLRAK